MTDVTHTAGGNGQLPPDDGWDWSGLLDHTEQDQKPASNGNGLAAKLKDRLLTADQLVALPPPDWLVDDLLNKGSLAVLYGKPGSGKSFVALDWALCVANGLHWAAREVRGGPVLYVAAEGIGGLGVRVRAWSQAFNHDPTGIHFLPGAVNLLDHTRSGALTELARELQPALVVIDTLARSMVGGDENSAKDVGIAVDTADHLRAATGATVLLVHHTSKDGHTYRGSSALEGGVETMIECKAEGENITIRSEKAKDAEQFRDIYLRRETVRLIGQLGHDSDSPHEGTYELTSCVVRPDSPMRRNAALEGSNGTVLQLLRDEYETTGASTATLVEASGVSKAQVSRAANALVKEGLVRNVGSDTRAHWKVISE